MVSACPSCGTSVSIRQVYGRDGVPVFNNLLFDDRDSALKAATGSVALARCGECGFVFNTAFDPDSLKYTDAYDSTRGHSPFVQQHLREVADFSVAGLPAGIRILEIGCGDGSFLTELHQRVGGHCDGFDVVCRSGSLMPGLTLHGRHFEPAIEENGYDLVLMRHVLEHIPQPGPFIAALAAAGTVKRGGRIAIEVPDLAWIIDHKVFFDITYEHCNYFDANSLSYLLARIGFSDIDVRKMFGGQYLVVSAVYGYDSLEEMKYHTNLYDFSGLERAQENWVNRIERADFPCIWGASGKGCLALAALNVDILSRISHVIDTNSKKQGRFMPKCGMKIEPPAALQAAGHPVTVFVMNPVYRDEIARQIQSLEVEARLEIVS